MSKISTPLFFASRIFASEFFYNDDGIVVVEDKWTCCDKEIDSKFCPDCGKQNNNDTASNTEITKENSNNKGE